MADDDAVTDFAVVGGGWWAEVYLRIAASLPSVFRVSSMVVRREEAGAVLEAAWPGLVTYRTITELLASSQPAFLVIAVPQPANAEVLAEAVATDIPCV